MTDLKDHIVAGLNHGSAVLDVRAAEYGDEQAIAFAAGVMTGLRDWLVVNHGRDSASVIITALANDTFDPKNVIQLFEAAPAGRA